MAIIGLTCRNSGSLSFSAFATGGIVAPDESARAPVHHLRYGKPQARPWSTDNIEDILITLDSQYHLIRLIQGRRGGDALFLYLALSKNRANLGLARHQLRKIEAELEI
jgi:hypothetical protein